MSLPIQDMFGPRPKQVVQPLAGPLGLLRGRVHECCGPARGVMAALLMARSAGPVLWISPAWQGERLFPDGLAGVADPSRLVMVQGRRVPDLLWAMEEGLRSGTVPLVVAELPELPALTPVRRLQLAAESGAEAAAGRRGLPPLGLMLTAGEGGVAGVESRWRMACAPARSSLLDAAEVWRLERLRARGEEPAAFTLRREGDGVVVG